jgi:nucleoid-associated protein YgaU
MGSVAEAVLEFDEAVQVPWRPRLAEAVRPTDPSTGVHVLALPSSRRPRAARAARLTVPPPLPPEHRTLSPRRPAGSTAVGHSCARCGGDDREVPAVRLTARARRLLAVLVTAVAIVLGIWVGSVVDGGNDGLVLVSDSSVVVHEDDTLWSIAGAVAGDQDIRAVVDAIRELNGLDDATLQPGQVLRLP